MAKFTAYRQRVANAKARNLITREFPDYPLRSIPADVPTWLICCAWHHDVAPVWGDASYVRGDGGIALGIDYPDEDRREMKGYPRFSVWRTDDAGAEMGDIFTSDDWPAVLAELQRQRGG